MSKSRGVVQQQGNKYVQNSRPHDLHTSILTHRGPAIRDEFKYGFPSHGLSTASNKWWGSSSADDSDEGSHENGGEDIKEDEQQSKESVDDSGLGTEKFKSRTDESNNGLLGTVLLSSLRKKPTEEGRKVLKLGVYQGYGVNRLGTRERMLLRGIFKSSLPSEWKNGSF